MIEEEKEYDTYEKLCNLHDVLYLQGFIKDVNGLNSTTIKNAIGLIDRLQVENFNIKRENEELKEFKVDNEYIRRIKSFLKWNIIIAEDDVEKITYRPIKNTTKQDIYEAYYEIQELLEMRKYDNLIK